MCEQQIVKSTYGVLSHTHKPPMKDITAVDGILMYGYRKVREKNGIGFIHAHSSKFGCEELANHKGRWVLIDISDYWALSARIGISEPFSEQVKESGLQYMGIKCPILRASDL